MQKNVVNELKELMHKLDNEDCTNTNTGYVLDTQNKNINSKNVGSVNIESDSSDSDDSCSSSDSIIIKQKSSSKVKRKVVNSDDSNSD